jgi:hypothetical protein
VADESCSGPAHKDCIQDRRTSHYRSTRRSSHHKSRQRAESNRRSRNREEDGNFHSNARAYSEVGGGRLIHIDRDGQFCSRGPRWDRTLFVADVARRAVYVEDSACSVMLFADRVRSWMLPHGIGQVSAGVGRSARVSDPLSTRLLLARGLESLGPCVVSFRSAKNGTHHYPPNWRP